MRSNLLLSGLFLFVLLCSSLVVLVDATTLWCQIYGGPETDCVYSLVATSDGGYALAGSTSSFGAGKDDFWLVKINADGVMQWNKTYGGTNGEHAYSLVTTSDGGYALVGKKSSPWSRHHDTWLVKTDASGNMQWNKTYEGTMYEYAASLVTTSDGGYALAGITEYGELDRALLLIKTDKHGNMEWNQTYAGKVDDDGNSLVTTSNGGYAAACGSLLVKTDAFGNMEWNQTLGGDAYSLVETPDGGYAVAGTTVYGAGYRYSGDSVAWLIKTDSNGVTKWSTTIGGELAHPHNSARSVIATSDGGYALAGNTWSSGAGYGDFWLVKINSNGLSEWAQTYGGTGTEGATCLIETADGGYITVGNGPASDKSCDLWLVKTDAFGFSTPTMPTPTAPTSTNSSWLFLLLAGTVIFVATVIILFIVIKRKAST